MANKENECAGISRSLFKLQALCDEKETLSAMACVDLNLTKTAMANTPETTDHTRIKLRIAWAWSIPCNSSPQTPCISGNDKCHSTMVN